jgi:tetratricopeptide (TPR) repeat protein
VARGLVQQASGNLEGAISDYSDAIRLDSRLAIAYYGRALAYQARGDNDPAAEDFAETFKLNPQLREKGQTEIGSELKSHPPRILFPNEMVWVDSFELTVLINRGETLLQKRRFDLAIAALNRAMLYCQHGRCTKVDGAGACFVRGEAYAKLQNYDQAIADYSEAIKFNAQDPSAYSRRALAYDLKGEIDLAIADYSRSIQIYPEDADVYYWRGLAYQRKGDFERAIFDSNQTIKFAPKSYRAFNMRCWIRATFGRDLAAALQDCNKALQLKPDAAAPFSTRGLVQFRLGAFAKAVADETAALAKEPDDAASFYVRGVARLRLGDKFAGNADIEVAKRIEPNIADIYARYRVR